MKNTNQPTEMTATIVNIQYSPTRVFKSADKSKLISDLPTTMELAIPENIASQKDKPDFEDVLESFVYNRISGIHGRPVTHCQIWLS